MKKLYTSLFALGLAITVNAQLGPNLVAHYPFNNSLNDASGNNYHLSGFGHLFGTDRNGTINESMYFDSVATGGKDSVEGITQLNNQEFTISFWIMPDTNGISGTKSINTGYSSATNNYVWSFEMSDGFSSAGGSSKTRGNDSSGIDLYVYHTNFSLYATATLGVPNNKWSFVTATCKKNDSIIMYINGVKNQWAYSTVEFPFSYFAGASDKLTFGHLSSAYFNTLTKLDEYKIYNKKATDAEVMQMYLSYPLAVKELTKNNQVAIYPNPAVNSISFILDNIEKNAMATVISIDGKIVESKDIVDLNTTLNIEKLSKGLYILQIQNGKETLTSKFIKE